MKKIIFGITSLTLGGAERVLVDLANKMSERFDITIFMLYSNGELETELNKKIKLKTLYSKKYTELTFLEKILASLKVLINKKKIFKKYVDKEEYIAQISFLEGAITRIFSVKSNFKTKKIAWVHNDMQKVFGKGIKAKIKKIMDEKAYQKYDDIIFVSKDNEKAFNSFYKKSIKSRKNVIKNYVSSERILNLSVELSEYKKIYKEDEINVVQVSRLVEQKAIDRLIKVSAKLIKENSKIHIYVIGDGPLKGKLQKQIIDFNVEEKFTLLGAKKNPYPYIKNADVFGLFSYFEGYGIVIDEAKMLQKYVIITDTAAREALKDYKKYSYIVSNDEKGIIEAFRYIENKGKQIGKTHIDYEYKNEEIINKITEIIERK